MKKYVLDEEGNVRPEEDLEKWSLSRENGSFIVKKEEIGDYEISTVFLGLDHSFAERSSVPILWETMVFAKKPNDPLDNYFVRCGGSKEQALAMHQSIIFKINSLLTP